VAIIIPIFAVLMFLALNWPTAEPVLEAIAVAFEGYSIYCYFALLVVYCGGRLAVMEMIKESPYTLCCTRCMRFTPGCCLSTIEFGLLQIIVLRPIVILVYGLEVMAGHDYFILSLVGSIQMILAMIGLARLYRVLYDNAKGMGATAKILVIKVLILFLMIQDLILQSVESSGVFDSSPGFG
jgi:hypothetical protein